MMQSEAQLESGLVKRLEDLGWAPAAIPHAAALRANLRAQLDAHNSITLSDGEFARVLSHLDKGNVFDKAHILRDRYALLRDDSSTTYIQFLNSNEWCRNRYQVTSQIAQEGSYRNRYDVTLLVNGLPLVQIELKRRGLELKEAFNQVNRYQRHSFWSAGGLFQYVQIFVISNGVNTKYYANNRDQDFKQTFFWADEANQLITQLDAFADSFLEKCHVSKMMAKYIVLHQSDRVLMVLRPYQYYAVEAIAARVGAGRKNGHIWHATGSGKTLTSFKAAQLLVENPKVRKVVFVVDRADLDYQTTKEFNHFAEGSVDGTDNTKTLVDQLAGEHRLIVTTIQKLNMAITRNQYDAALQLIKDERIVFIFDECHRSQFGDTHKNIVAYFSKAQMFGFTGTPIFADNAVGKRTTWDLFGECLHRYVITDAISDQNVLRLSIEYWGKLRRKDGSLIDEEVAGINTKEFFENLDRIESIVDWIIKNHGRKTRGQQFGAMLCVSSVSALISYYDTFKRRALEGAHKLKVATIFTYASNEEDDDASGLLGDPSFDISPDVPETRQVRERLSEFVADYNALYHTNESVRESRGFYTYYRALAKRMKERDKKGFIESEGLDLLIVVNMFLTGFDAKTLNTLYVDKNLRYHGLIQAFSRTNRVLGQVKSQGNIVCFRNLKKKTDEAITLFSRSDASETILLAPYEDYVAEFAGYLTALRAIAPAPSAVDDLRTDSEILMFVQAFRSLIRVRNIMASFADFDAGALPLSTQEFEDYKSKYLDIHDRTKRVEPGERVSIVDDVDFELELIRRDEINVAYILELLSSWSAEGDGVDGIDLATRRRQVFDLLGSEIRLRSKRALIEEFIEQHAAQLTEGRHLRAAFQQFWDRSRDNAIRDLCKQENVIQERLLEMIARYQFTGKRPLGDEIISALTIKPSVLRRKLIIERVTQGLVEIVEKFNESIGDIGQEVVA
jgi:type I restriction enzyme, R subunit